MQPSAWPFLEPVDPVALNLPDYFEKVLYPMDLGTIEMKANTNQYPTFVELVADVHLTFDNAELYNPKDHEVYRASVRLRAFFKRKLREEINNRHTGVDQDQDDSGDEDAAQGAAAAAAAASGGKTLKDTWLATRVETARSVAQIARALRSADRLLWDAFDFSPPPGWLVEGADPESREFFKLEDVEGSEPRRVEIYRNRALLELALEEQHAASDARPLATSI